MEDVCLPANFKAAIKAVRKNKGSAGIDNMNVDELEPWLRDNFSALTSSLISGKYHPQAILSVDIPKGNDSVRTLGIATVIDRCIQQAVLQKLTPIFDPSFSSSSYGFRPGRSAHQAVKAASEYVDSGLEYVVDIDLDNFFDRVQHDLVMVKLSAKVKDKRILQLIGRYLRCGVLRHGVIRPKSVGTMQGGPLSPLLSNILLDDLDKELERRGHRFCRYADDCNIYVASQRSADRILNSVSDWIERKLKLKVNIEKSQAVACWQSKFLGFTLTLYGPKIADKSIFKLKDKVRWITSKRRPISMRTRFSELKQLFTGWINYFHLSVSSKKLLANLDSWTRRRLRLCALHGCKRVYTRVKLLVKLGVPRKRAWMGMLSGKSLWRLAKTPAVHEGLSNRWLRGQGLVSLEDSYVRLKS